jgi:hypothetical protein
LQRHRRTRVFRINRAAPYDHLSDMIDSIRLAVAGA